MRTPKFPNYPTVPHASKQARIRWRGKDYYLGLHGSEASYAEYARLTALFATNPGAIPVKPQSVTIAQMIAAWHDDAVKWVKPKELRECVRAALVLERLYGPTPASEFDVACLSVVRDAMISGSWMAEAERAELERTKGTATWCKNHVQHQLNRVKRIFRFAEQRRLVPRGTWEHLRTLRPLRRGEVRETAKRRPVEESVVLATLPHLSLMVSSMVQVQLLTGMRPSELCGMRVDRFEPGPEGSQLYRLDEFKTRQSDEWQFVVLGPEAQRIIAPWLDAARALAHDAYLWRPKPGKAKPYTQEGYYQHVHDGSVRAGGERWYPYRLRHTAKRRITRIAGSDAARAVLRQRTIDATQHYAAQQDVQQAAKIQAKAG